MKRNTLAFILAALLGFSSCISNKHIVYLQDRENGDKAEFQEKVVDRNSAEYRLEKNDIISVKIDHLQVSKEFETISESDGFSMRQAVEHPMLIGYTIDDDGEVDLPTMGKVMIGGLTVHEASNVLKEKAKEFYTNASVKVFLLNYYITVLGEVKDPGRYPVYMNELSIFEAIGMAGDATDFANREQVRILRTRGKKNMTLIVNLNDDKLLSSGRMYLQPNDVIILSPLSRKKYIRRDPQNVYNFVSTIVSLVTLYLLVR